VLPDNTDVSAGIQLRTLQAFGYSATGGDLSGARFGSVALQANAVPEPGALALGGLALLAAFGLRRR
jgi:PEP-CTERM motif